MFVVLLMQHYFLCDVSLEPNMLLVGWGDSQIGPWLTGAPLIALQKKDGGIRPIAVGEVIRHLASRFVAKQSPHSC